VIAQNQENSWRFSLARLKHYKRNKAIDSSPAPTNKVLAISIRPATPFFNSGFPVELAPFAPADEALGLTVTVTAPPAEADAVTATVVEAPDTEIW
jgi:hypothetical protein